MDLKSYIETSKHIMARSPLRLNEFLPIDYPREAIKKCVDEMELLGDKLSTPLKVVCMGEVKAGKSTLVNTLVGKSVAFTDALEATASIMEIEYNQEESVEIVKNDGNVKVSLDELNDFIKMNQDNVDFFENWIKVIVKTPMPALRTLHIVDTPGLATITEANSKTTESCIQNADVILWVLNGNYIGQTDINDKIAEVHDYGKPIIGLVNRIDEVDADPDEIIDYVEDEMDIYFDRVMAISAYHSHKAKLNNDLQALDQWGYNDLLHYLTHDIERNSQEIQSNSIKDSTESLLDNDIYYHKTYIDKLGRMIDRQNSLKQKAKLMAGDVEDRIHNELYNWKKSFLKDELAEAEGYFKGLNPLKIKDELSSINMKINNLFSEKKIERQVERLKYKIDDIFNVEWQRHVTSLSKEIMNDFEQIENESYQTLVNYVSTNENTLLEGLKVGGALSGSAGIALAGYQAALGPFAASITMGSALASVMPPVLLVGSAIGITYKVINAKQSVENQKDEVLKRLEDVRSQVTENVLNDFKSIVKKENDRNMNEFIKLNNRLLVDWSDDEIEKHQDSILVYIEAINNHKMEY